MITRVVSGGQTGADQAGWRAAKRCGIATGGWMPKGWKTEAGLHPEFAVEFGAVEHASADYRERTKANVRDSDGTVWFGSWLTPGGSVTLDSCRIEGRSFYLVYERISRPSEVAAWIVEKNIGVLNVAGNRESKAQGIGERVERWLVEVFRRLGHAHR